MLLARDFSRPMLMQHILALATCLTLIGLVAFDRRPPLAFLQGEVVPQQVAPGSIVHVRWTTQWSRQCLGMVSRDIVGSDGVIRIYARHSLRIPAALGVQSSDTPFTLSNALPQGNTRYRAVVQFETCGLTSRIWPLSVDAPTLAFKVI